MFAYTGPERFIHGGEVAFCASNAVFSLRNCTSMDEPVALSLNHLGLAESNVTSRECDAALLDHNAAFRDSARRVAESTLACAESNRFNHGGEVGSR